MTTRHHYYRSFVVRGLLVTMLAAPVTALGNLAGPESRITALFSLILLALFIEAVLYSILMRRNFKVGPKENSFRFVLATGLALVFIWLWADKGDGSVALPDPAPGEGQEAATTRHAGCIDPLVSGTAVSLFSMDRCIANTGCAGAATSLAAEIGAGNRPDDGSLLAAASTLMDVADAQCVLPVLRVTESLADPRRRLSALKLYADQLCAAVGPATFRGDQAAAALLDRHGIVASCS